MANIFDKETLIPIGLVTTLLAAALSFGVMYEQVSRLSRDVDVLQSQMTVANSKLDTLIGRLSVAKE